MGYISLWTAVGSLLPLFKNFVTLSKCMIDFDSLNLRDSVARWQCENMMRNVASLQNHMGPVILTSADRADGYGRHMRIELTKSGRERRQRLWWACRRGVQSKRDCTRGIEGFRFCAGLNLRALHLASMIAREFAFNFRVCLQLLYKCYKLIRTKVASKRSKFENRAILM